MSDSTYNVPAIRVSRPGPLSRWSPKLCGAASLAIIGAYLLTVGPDVQIFPIGAIETRGSGAGRAFALGLALLLGWGIPGLPLALALQRTRVPDPSDGLSASLLARALGLGVGYIAVTGFLYGAIAGHAPTRIPLLVLLAIPCAAAMLTGRPGAASTRFAATVPRSLLVALAAIAILAIVLWPKLRHEGMNGDGSETYELARSLEASPVPRWDMEHAATPRFGTPIVVPYFTGAYLVFGGMTILGTGELAARLPFVTSLPILAILAVSAARSRGPTVWLYSAAVGAVYVLWSAFYVAYDPPFDIASPAGLDALAFALWMAGWIEATKRSPALGGVFMILACGVTYSGPILTASGTAFLYLLDRPRGRALLRTVAVLGGLSILLLLAAALMSGILLDWARDFRHEYWDDFVSSARRVSGTGLLVRFLLLTGGLVLFVPFGWRRLDAATRALALTGAMYLALVLGGAFKSLHYLIPLAWIFLPAAIAATGGRVRTAAIAIVAATFAMSWPDIPGGDRQTVALGRESCVQGLDYERAALASAPLSAALAAPDGSATGRFAVSRHTFVRYALDLGGRDCVLGLSSTLPAGAVPLVDGPAVIWTTDVDRFAGWRLRPMPRPSSWLFPRALSHAYDARAETWTGRIDLSQEPGRSLLLASTRVLVPVTNAGRAVRLEIISTTSGQVEARVNNDSTLNVPVESGRSSIAVPGHWRAGWNVLELGAGGDVTLAAIENDD